MRLDKFLTETGHGTRSQVKSIIKLGNVSVNGDIVKKPEFKVDELSDKVFISGSEIKYTRYEYFMLNKPSGYVSATEDKNEKTVVSLIKDSSRSDLFPVGRLDKDTEGLLIISNDGVMAHNILSPRHHISKTYYVKVSGRVSEEHINLFKKGVDIGEDKLTSPAELEIIVSDDISEVLLTIYEGKFHQVKRMFKSIGMNVEYLKRMKMGNLELDENLKLGEYRSLSENEIDYLTKL